MKMNEKFEEKLVSIKENLKDNTESRIPFVETPQEKISVEKWKEIINRNFPELLFAAETAASIICQLLINDITNPFGLVLIDVPSAGKTIVLNFFSTLDSIVYTTDKFSPASFVSHAVNVQKKDLAKIDLLPRIRHRVLMVRDLATIFAEREEDLSNNIGILTRIFDGEGYESDTGVHGKRGYNGDYCFMMLAASTPIPPRVWKMMGNFGSRLFFINIDSEEKDEETLAKQLQSETCRKKEKRCRETTKHFIETLFAANPHGVEWDTTTEDTEYTRIIARASALLAYLRAPINVWKEYSGDDALDHSIPLREMPDRINQLLYNMARGHAVMSGRNQINAEDINIVLEVAFSSAPVQRVKTFKTLLDNGGELTTGKAIAALNCSRPTAIKELTTLNILGITHKTFEEAIGEEIHVKLQEKFKWFLSDQCKTLRGLIIPASQGHIPFTPNDHKANPTLYSEYIH